MFGSFQMTDLMNAVARIIVLLIALPFHEWGHAFAAHKMGDDTARLAGRMTLDPFRHLDPIGTISMIFVGFGWAKPVPVNPNNFRKQGLGMAVVSVAGVAVNFVLAFLSAFLLYALGAFGITAHSFLLTLLYNFIIINISLMVFNLIPIPPLDGYQFIKPFLLRFIPLKFFWNYERVGRIILLIVVFTPVFSWIYTPVVNGILSGFDWLFSLIFGLG